MKNETFVFIDDIRQKKTTAAGAHHKVVKTGCKLPFEYKTRKELKSLMNSPIISSNPLPMKDFRKLSIEDQQRQLDLWKERYGASGQIFGLLTNTSQRTASRELLSKNLSFEATDNRGTDHKKKLAQTKLVCEAFYDRKEVIENRRPTEEEAQEVRPDLFEDVFDVEPEIEIPTPKVVEKSEIVEAKPTARVELANPSRFNFTIDGVFYSKEVQTLLYAVRTAVEANEDKAYKLTITLEEA